MTELENKKKFIEVSEFSDHPISIVEKSILTYIKKGKKAVKFQKSGIKFICILA